MDHIIDSVIIICENRANSALEVDDFALQLWRIICSTRTLCFVRKLIVRYCVLWTAYSKKRSFSICYFWGKEKMIIHMWYLRRDIDGKYLSTYWAFRTEHGRFYIESLTFHHSENPLIKIRMLTIQLDNCGMILDFKLLLHYHCY